MEVQANSLAWGRGRYDFRVPQEHWVPTQRDQPRVLPGGKAGGPQPFRRPGPSEGALMAAARGDGRGPEKGGGVREEPQPAGGGAAGGAAKAGSEHALTAVPSKKQLILQLCDVQDSHLQACCRAPRAPAPHAHRHPGTPAPLRPGGAVPRKPRLTGRPWGQAFIRAAEVMPECHTKLGWFDRQTSEQVSPPPRGLWCLCVRPQLTGQGGADCKPRAAAL